MFGAIKSILILQTMHGTAAMEGYDASPAQAAEERPQFRGCMTAAFKVIVRNGIDTIESSAQIYRIGSFR
jgi:hypothetical protein